MRSHCLIFWLACSLPLGAAAHPFHGCTGEAEWNPRTEHLEVALRVDAPGLERALRRHRQAAVDLDRTEMLETLLADYVRDTFQIEQADGRIAQLIWVGQEINLQDAWLYFEIPVEQRQQVEAQ